MSSHCYVQGPSNRGIRPGDITGAVSWTLLELFNLLPASAAAVEFRSCEECVADTLLRTDLLWGKGRIRRVWREKQLEKEILFVEGLV